MLLLQPPMIKPPSPAVAPLSPGSVSSRTVNILQEMKAKNDRLERLLRSALDDIKELKQREKLREQHNITMQSLVQLQNIGPADEFRKGVPALAMFALSEERHGAVLQANETFRDLVGSSFDQLATPGFTCCQLFPERFKSKLSKDYKDIMVRAHSLVAHESCSRHHHLTLSVSCCTPTTTSLGSSRRARTTSSSAAGTCKKSRFAPSTTSSTTTWDVRSTRCSTPSPSPDVPLTSHTSASSLHHLRLVLPSPPLHCTK